jgi:hypothetical protein
MNKTIHIIGLLILLAIIFYLAKELYFYYNNKENLSLLSQALHEQHLTGGGIATYNAPLPPPPPPPPPPSSDATSPPPPPPPPPPPSNYFQDKTNNYKFDASKKYQDIISNLDVQFHDDFTSEKDDYGLASGTAFVIDKDGKRVALPPSGLKTPVTYFKPQDYVYGSLSYVPNYEDSVYLSRTANMYIGQPIIETASIKAGMCNYYKNNPDQLEQACQHTDPNICASTSCCVLLGGAKCVSGSENGPIMKSHYSNTSIPNRDFYYFQSKCYGNCPRQ